MGNVEDSNRYKGKGHVTVHLLITLFGISAWIGINGIFVEVPVLINTSPEGWTLPAYLVLVIQAANFGPLLYAILQRFQCELNETWWILCVLVSGTFAMGLLTFFYSEITVVAGVEHSLVLFILTFCNALVGCFSSVLFMPYLRKFNEIYLISYFIGEGLSGVLPSIVALIQGIGDNSECMTLKNDTMDSSDHDLEFSPGEYFLFIFIILFLSLSAFAILEYSSFVKNIKGQHKSPDYYDDDVRSIKHSSIEENNKIEDSFHHNNSKCLTKQMEIYLFILLAVCCFFSNGFFPSIQSYSCLPYGNIAYKLSITFAQFANPLVCLLAFWLIVSNVKVINCLFVACLIIGSYVTYLGLMSPTPPLQKTKLGIILVVTSWTLLIGCISYLKLIIVSVFRSTTQPKMLFKAGLLMQVGSASGAIFTFIIINYTNYFKMHDNCA